MTGKLADKSWPLTPMVADCRVWHHPDAQQKLEGKTWKQISTI
jgi:hypothetical protein